MWLALVLVLAVVSRSTFAIDYPKGKVDGCSSTSIFSSISLGTCGLRPLMNRDGSASRIVGGTAAKAGDW